MADPVVFCRSLRPDGGRLAEEGGGFRRLGIRQLSLEELEAARRIIIGEDVWLGGGAIICLGVTIGADAVVGAGAVITRTFRQRPGSGEPSETDP